MGARSNKVELFYVILSALPVDSEDPFLVEHPDVHEAGHACAERAPAFAGVLIGGLDGLRVPVRPEHLIAEEVQTEWVGQVLA